jgi:hypothetical protein
MEAVGAFARPLAAYLDAVRHLAHQLGRDCLNHRPEPLVLEVELAQGREHDDELVHRSIGGCVGHQYHGEARCDAGSLVDRERDQVGLDPEARLRRPHFHLVLDDVEEEFVHESACEGEGESVS